MGRDVGNSWHPDYVWHEGAQIIQSPEGRQFLDSLRKPNGSYEGFLRPRGISDAVLAEIDETVDETMTNTIYDLYRDATPNLYAYNGWGLKMNDAASTPGMLVAPEEDPFGSVDLSGETAERLKAKFLVLPGKSHYWTHQDPTPRRCCLASSGRKRVGDLAASARPGHDVVLRII